jgi:hypothetical protein
MGNSDEFGGEEARWTASTSGDDVESQHDEPADLSQVRSQNGHGCAELSEKNGSTDDPFEVSFTGDDDPMCPRSSK